MDNAIRVFIGGAFGLLYRLWLSWHINIKPRRVSSIKKDRVVTNLETGMWLCHRHLRRKYCHWQLTVVLHLKSCRTAQSLSTSVILKGISHSGAEQPYHTIITPRVSGRQPGPADIIWCLTEKGTQTSSCFTDICWETTHLLGRSSTFNKSGS